MEQPKIEALHGLMLTETTVVIAVTSSGCTDRSDFKVRVKESEPPQVEFVRVQPDVCKAMAHTVDIRFSLKEIGASRFQVVNPMEPGPPRLGFPQTKPKSLALSIDKLPLAEESSERVKEAFRAAVLKELAAHDEAGSVGGVEFVDHPGPLEGMIVRPKEDIR